MIHWIRQDLAGHPWCETIQYFDTIESTNSHAKALAAAGAPEGTILIAGQQTGGRGRLGRSFSSPAGMGIYLSLILRPNCLPEELMHLTCAAGVAAAKALDDPRVGIKWTNDLVIGKKKLGGILTEISIDPSSRKLEWAVIGIGINCCQHRWDFPAEIRDIACSLHMDRQDIPALVCRLIHALYEMNGRLLTEKDAIMAQFTRLCVTLNQEISIHRGDEVRHGKALAVDECGGLVVELSDGTVQTVTSGEVSIRGMYGYL